MFSYQTGHACVFTGKRVYHTDRPPITRVAGSFEREQSPALSMEFWPSNLTSSWWNIGRVLKIRMLMHCLESQQTSCGWRRKMECENLSLQLMC